MQRNCARQLHASVQSTIGQVYHRTGSLLPWPITDYKSLQMYSVENNDEKIDCITKLFDKHNKLIQLFSTVLYQIPVGNYRVVVRADKTYVSQHEK